LYQVNKMNESIFVVWKGDYFFEWFLVFKIEVSEIFSKIKGFSFVTYELLNEQETIIDKGNMKGFRFQKTQVVHIFKQTNDFSLLMV
jgi:hypothetical protein